MEFTVNRYLLPEQRAAQEGNTGHSSLTLPRAHSHPLLHSEIYAFPLPAASVTSRDQKIHNPSTYTSNAVCTYLLEHCNRGGAGAEREGQLQTVEDQRREQLLCML